MSVDQKDCDRYVKDFKESKLTTVLVLVLTILFILPTFGVAWVLGTFCGIVVEVARRGFRFGCWMIHRLNDCGH